MEKLRKVQVLQYFLAFVRKYVSLDDAIVASLGGQGTEAGLWQKAGIPGSNGWVIERSKKHAKHLIGGSNYRYTADLANFPRAFRAVNGRDAGLDAFHLDLSGTIEPVVQIVRPIIRLLMNGRGRCLAITVADARRNLSVEQFATVEKTLSRLLGFRYSRMQQRLHLEKQEERELGSMREIGFFYSVLKLLKFYGRSSVPNQVVRYSYVSYESNRPFPMRTYFFHFSNEPARMSDQEFAKKMYCAWFKNDLVFLNGTSRRMVGKKAPELVRMPERLNTSGEGSMSQTKRLSTMSELAARSAAASPSEFEKIAAVANAIGGEVLEQYELLLRRASIENDPFLSLMGDLNQLVQRYIPENLGGTMPEHPLVVRSSRPRRAARHHEPQHDSVASKPRRKTHAVKKTKSAPLPGNGVMIEISLDLLKAAAEGSQQLKVAKKEAARKLKLSRHKNRGYRIGGILAHTQGKFRKQFLVRLAKHDPASINANLATIYSKIDEKDVSLDQLKAEAGLG